MIMRKRTLAVMALAGLSGGLLLYTSQKVQQAEDRLSDLRAELAMQEEAIDVLEAEWAYLNNPQRLEDLATKYLDLKPPNPESLGLDPEALRVMEEARETDGALPETIRAQPALYPVPLRKPEARKAGQL